MKKSRYVQIINRSHGVAVLFFLTMGSCHAGDYEIKENCAPIDTCGDGIDNDCKNGIDDGCDCMILGEQRLRIPLMQGKDDPLLLTFGPSSACKLDTEVCKDQNSDGKYKWISSKTGRGPSAMNDATCDGIDDDCDGKIDEDFPSGTPCLSPGNAKGLCKAAGVTVCNPKTNKTSCSVQDRTMSPTTTYYSYPYIIGPLSPTPDWDWTCDGSVSFLTCQLSALKNLSYFDIPAALPSNCAFSIAPPSTVSAIQPYASPLCSPCIMTNAPYWQYASSQSLPASAQTSECGRIIPIVQCSGTTTSNCKAINIDSLIVLCQ